MELLVGCDMAFFHKFERKLALFVGKYDNGTSVLLEHLKYPYIDFDIANEDRGNIMIFKNEDVKRQFSKELNIIEDEEKISDSLNMCKRHMLVGRYVGFPPKAVEYFSYEKYKRNGYYPVNIPINYYGLYFASYPETLDEDIIWLENTYRKPFKEEMIRDIFNVSMQLKMHEIVV